MLDEQGYRECQSQGPPRPAYAAQDRDPCQQVCRGRSKGQTELISRYDLLCIEGLARALRIFLQKDTPPTYTLSTPAKLQEVFVEPSVCSLIVSLWQGVADELDIPTSTLLRLSRPPTRSTHERTGIREFHRFAG